MFDLRSLAVGVLTGVLLGCSQGTEPEDRRTSTRQLSESSLAQGLSVEQVAALSGDVDAARRLMLAASELKDNKADFVRWAQIAAENGGANSAYSYAFFILNDDFARNKQRGIFWLDRAMDGGNEDARSMLERVAANPAVDPITGRRVHAHISMNEREASALSGDPVTAAVLCREASIESGNEVDKKFWCRVAAQNGDASSIGVYAEILESSDDVSDRVRSSFWKNKIHVQQ